MSKVPSISFVLPVEWWRASTLRPREFAERLVAAGGRAWLVIRDSKESEGAQPPAGVELVKVVDAPVKAYVQAVREAIAEQEPDYVYFLNPSGRAYLIARGGLPAKIIGDWEDWRVAWPFKWYKKLPLWYVDRWFRKRADVVVTVSAWLKGEFERRGRREVHYIPYAPMPADEPPDMPCPFDRPTAVYMGAMVGEWDQRVVLEAAARLKERGDEPAICLVGGGPELEPMRAWITEHGLTNVTMPGHLPRQAMLNHLRHAHVLLFPIRDTAANRARCPFKSFQYAQARRPVITCRVGEVARTLGEQAAYVDCTPAAFAEAMAQAMAEPRGADVDYGIEQHTWDDRFERLMAAVQH